MRSVLQTFGVAVCAPHTFRCWRTNVRVAESRDVVVRWVAYRWVLVAVLDGDDERCYGFEALHCPREGRVTTGLLFAVSNVAWWAHRERNLHMALVEILAILSSTKHCSPEWLFLRALGRGP